MKNFKKNKLIFLMTSFFIFINIFKINTKAQEINVDARNAVAIDSKTKIILYEKNAHMLVPMASTTKIMTALVAINYGNLDKKIEISSKAASIKGSTVGYKKGELITLRELLYGLMLRSGNDAAIAIAEGIAGSVDEFVKLMNTYAVQIGVLNTHFESPHGLDSEEHYSTAYDLAVITSKAKENELFNEIVKSKDVDGNSQNFSRSFHNINKILWQIPNANGVKTGYTGKAGKCLVSSVNIQGNDVIIVVLNCPNRWNETQKINDYINKKYEFKKIFSKNDIVKEILIKNGENPLKIKVNKDIILPIKKDSDYKIKINIPNYNLYAPINKGSKIGNITIYLDDKNIYKESLESNNYVKDKNILKKWLFKK
ncbi:D-alanyl-D-alanine carboxypeptidase family protein [Clostridium prolinivorans]|uniref:D-alanyl-D-alanine carboxypeptidase family protein n=1 Tax=Clostridium prolinivorans TaxID=2769420 RepID=UPI000FDB9A3F|nr:D-alanyl-D-alanine carboxypeptidase family protein [Clostridium prolinivorans]